MWEIYLQQIREEKELYDEEINSGASEKEIYELVTTAKEKWNMEIPQQYLDVLSRINGIEFNVFILYGVDQYLLEHEMKQLVYGLLEFNHIWYENEKQREYLFLGESNISWYVYQYKINVIWNWISRLEEKSIDSVIFTKCLIRFWMRRLRDKEGNA